MANKKSATPRVDALMLEINEGRTYETVGPLTDLARQLEAENAALSDALREMISHLEFLQAAEKSNYSTSARSWIETARAALRAKG